MNLRAQVFPHPRRQPVRFVLSCLLCAYLLVIACPGLLFAERVQDGGIIVHAHRGNGSSTGLDDDLRKAETLVSRSTLEDRGLKQDIYLTGSHAEYSMFAPAARHSLGATYHVVNTTFLPPSDPAADVVHSDRARFGERPLSAVMAHERMHALLEHHFGLHILLADTWKQEGYCDYVAGSPSVGDFATGLRLLEPGESKEPAVLYFRDTLRVRYLLEQQYLSVDAMFARHVDPAALDSEALTFYTAQSR